MIRRHIAVCLYCSLFITNILFGQTASEELSYLQKNIRIWVLLQPNTDKPEFYRVRPTGVFLDTDGIIMGKSSNNGMTNSAKLLSALFKDPAKRSNGGDGRLQEIMYSLVKSFNKPVDIYFFNDKMNPIKDEYLDKYKLYSKLNNENSNKVFSGTYLPQDNNDTTAGRIVIGEPSSLDLGKSLLVRTMTFLYLNHYSYVNTTGVKIQVNLNPPAAMYAQKQLNHTFPANDVRNEIFNAAASSLVLEAGNKNLEKEYYEWLASAPYLLVNSTINFKILKNITLADVPAKYLLNNQLKNSFINQKDTGYYLTNPPFDDEPDVLAGWKIYDIKNLNNYRRIRNEIILALVFKKYMDKFFSPYFFEALLYKDRRLEKASYENQLSFLIENLCMYGMDDNVPIGELTNKIHFYPLALMDMFLDFPIEIVDNNFYSARTFFGVFPENSFSPELLKAYFKLRPAIKEAAQKSNKKNSLSPIYSGYDNITIMCDGIWNYLYK